MASSVRVTKAQRFEDIIAMMNGEGVKYGSSAQDIVDFCVKEMALLAKKNASADKRKDAERAKDEVFKSLIADYLAGVEGGMTCSEIGKAIDELSAFNTSKLSSLCNAMVKDGTLVKASVKGKSLFSLA